MSKSVKDFFKKTPSTEYSDLRWPLLQEQNTYKDFVTARSQFVLGQLKQKSITHYILKRQTEPTNKINNTVQRATTCLKRELQVSKGTGQTYSPWWIPYRTGKGTWRPSRSSIQHPLYVTIAESGPTSTSPSQSRQEISKQKSTTTGALLAAGKADARTEKLLKRMVTRSTTNREGSGGTATGSRNAL